MDLLAWLRTLPADPTDASSPPVLVFPGDLRPGDSDLIKGTWYNRRPYIIVSGLPSNVESRLHDESSIMTSVIDVIVLQMGTTTHPTQAALKALWRLVQAAPAHVTALPNATLLGRLSLVTLVEPGDRPDDPTGIYATVRFRARHHQPFLTFNLDTEPGDGDNPDPDPTP